MSKVAPSNAMAMPTMFGPAPSPSMFGEMPAWALPAIFGGLGLMSGRNQAEQFQGGAQGLASGMAMSQQNQDRAEKKREEEQRRAALHGVMSGPDSPLGELSPSIAALYEAYPDLAVSEIVKRSQPQAQKWEKLDDNTLYDPLSGDTRDVGGPDQPDPATFANQTAVRKELSSQPGTSRYRTAQPIVASMVEAVDDPSAMSDLDFVYGMAKIFDPESVVRESEMGLVIEGQSVPAQIVGLFSKVASGEAVLQPEARRQLIEASLRRVGEYKKQAEQESVFYSDLAKRNQIDPTNIVQPLADMPPWQSGNTAIPLPSGGTLTPGGNGSFIWSPSAP